MVEPVGVYISVPFCKAKCTFCNFASDAFGGDRMQGYVERICGEIHASRRGVETFGVTLPSSVDSVYFGGGTPSLLSGEQFRRIFECLRGEFALAAAAEITLECAPGQLSDGTLEELLRQGLNRVSFGVQSFVDAESAAVGRLHTRQQCEEEVARVRVAGLEEINIDLIAGLPHQTEKSWRYSVERTIASGVPHVSVYMLEVDEESRLGREILEKGSRYSALAVPSEDAVVEWNLQACDALGAAGLEQYEISNFAREGHRSRHNLKYWRREPYVGFGLDAHSMLRTESGAVRFANGDDLDVYLDGGESGSAPLKVFAPLVPEVEVVGQEKAFEESLFLGLRLNEGVRLDALGSRFGEAMMRDVMPALQEVREAGLLAIEGSCARLTARGRMVSNEVFSRLLLASA
jgi:oxygen-independent coproporphyrinogen-3 oxidase